MLFFCLLFSFYFDGYHLQWFYFEGMEVGVGCLGRLKGLVGGEGLVEGYLMGEWMGDLIFALKTNFCF